MRNPDWTDLPFDLAEYIGGLLMADDLTDFIRFRAVCHPWRSSTVEMRSRADCLYPRNWITLSNPKLSPTEPVQFYNTLEHKSFWFDLTGYLDQYSPFRCFTCLIILQNNSTQEFALLNPFVRSITQLPSKIQSNCPKAPTQIEDIIHDSNWNRLSDVYVTSSSTIVLNFSTLEYLVWTKPGYGSWVYAELNIYGATNAVFYHDRILIYDPDMGIVQINFPNDMSSQPQVEVVIPEPGSELFMYARYLINCNGNLYVVLYPIDNGYSFVIYKLDLKMKTCFPSTNLSDYSIFLGARTFSVSGKKRLMPANCIYFCSERSGEKAMYNWSTNRLNFFTKKPFLNPNPFVRKLISFCERPTPIVLKQEDGSTIYQYED